MRSKTARVVLLAAAAAAVLLIVWLLARPRESATAPGATRVVIIGVDGLDWEIARSAVAEGRMPHLERLVRDGASGPLQSIPPFISPSIWTTIATGKREDKHGIRSFLATRRHGSVTAPTTSNMRKAKALWQIAGDRGLTVGFIGWLVTWPAEEVSGYMVSSLFERLVARSEARGAGDSTAAGEVDDSGAAYPADLVQSLDDFIVRPQDLPDETVARLLGTTRRSDEAEVAALEADLRRYMASDLSTLALAKQLMRSVPTDVCGVYFRGLDLSCHTFWRYRSPGEWPDDIPPGQVETFGPVIDRYYSFADSLIGEVAAAAGGAVVLVCSDHGFGGHGGGPGGDKPLIGTAMHRDKGVIAVAGPGVRRGVAVTDAGVLDVTPTVLAILGLPVGRDMDGRVLVDILTDDALTERPVAFIQTHEAEGTRGDSEPIQSPVDDEIKEMLRSLGYIE